MPTFTFTSPEGKSYDITGPEGSTKEQAFQILQQKIGGAKPASTEQPPAEKPSMNLGQANPIAEPLMAMGTGMIAKPVSDVAGLAALAAAPFSGGRIDPTAVKRRVQEAMTYEPKTEIGKALTEYNPLALAGKAVDWAAHGVGNVVRGTAGSDTLRGAAGNAIEEAIKQAPNFLGAKAAENPAAISQFAKDTAASAAKVAERAGKAVTPTLDAQTLAVAKKASDIGIKITPDMLTDNKFMRLIGQASRDVPLSGAVTHENRVAFNRAVIDSFGGDVTQPKITPQVFSSAMSKHGKTIGDLSEKYPIDINQGLKGGLDQYLMDMRRETPDVRNIVEGYVFDINQAAAKDGVIDGAAFRKIRSKLTGQMRRTNNGDLKYALSKLDDVMLDTIQSKLGEAERPVFDQARAYYANGKTVEPLIAKAAAKGAGDMSPAALANRITATGAGKTNVAMGRGGQLADIAAAGSRFITEPKSSMTAERGLTYGLLGGGTMVNPLAAAALYGGANLYNRLGPRIAKRIIKAQQP